MVAIFEKQADIPVADKKTVTKFRLKAAGLHLVISLLVALASVVLVFVVWHPAPLAKAVGVASVFLMMLAIDVVLGPLLTLLVAKPKKKTLKFDLAVIGAVQVAALCYGLYSISLNRPVYVSYDITRFELVQAKNVLDKQLEEASPPYDRLPMASPVWVAIKPPANADEQLKRMMDELDAGFSPSLQPKLYEPMDNQWGSLTKEKADLATLAKYNEQVQVDRVLAQYPNADGFFPLKVLGGVDMTVLIDSKNKQIVKIVDLRPW